MPVNTMPEKRIATLVQLACTLEACAPKPGNVNRHHDFRDASLEDFLCGAAACGAAFDKAETKTVGRLILDAATGTRALVRSNVNLGIILLFAPLAKACLNSAARGADIRGALRAVLDSLTVEDARLAYRAIRMLHPGGLGRVTEADVSKEPSVTLLRAMSLARERDSIAREYATAYEITFETGLPAFRDAWARSATYSDAIVHTFLTILGEVPDTLIARKEGTEAAVRASELARGVLARGSVFTAEGRSLLEAMDRTLRDPGNRMNPGTAADLTAGVTLLMLVETQNDAGGPGESPESPQ